MIEKEYPPGSQAVALTRVSAKTQAEEGLSLPEQLERSIAKAKSLGLALPEENIFIIEGESAFRIPPKGRQIYDKMLKMLEENDNIVAVVTWARHRLWRNHVEMVRLIDDMNKLGKDIVYYGDAPTQDINTATGWLIENVLAILPEYESRILAERVPPGQKRAKAMGYCTWRYNTVFWNSIRDHPEAEGRDHRRGKGLLMPTEFGLEVGRDWDAGLSKLQLWEKHGAKIRKRKQGRYGLHGFLKRYEIWKIDPIHGTKEAGGFVLTITSRQADKKDRTFTTPDQLAKRKALIAAIERDKECLKETGEPLFPTLKALAAESGYVYGTLARLVRDGSIDLDYRSGGPKEGK